MADDIPMSDETAEAVSNLGFALNQAGLDAEHADAVQVAIRSLASCLIADALEYMADRLPAALREHEMRQEVERSTRYEHPIISFD